LVYLLLVGVVVALGVKFVGTLLMGALVIVPAVAAKNISRSFKNYSLFSALIGILSAVIGVSLAYLFQFPAGPVIVLTSAAIFVLTFFLRKGESVC